MTTIALVGIDLGKRTFHVHAQDGHSNEVLRRQLNRSQLIRWLANLPPCTVAFESCCGAHWLSWKLREFGPHAANDRSASSAAFRERQ